MWKLLALGFLHIAAADSETCSDVNSQSVEAKPIALMQMLQTSTINKKTPTTKIKKKDSPELKHMRDLYLDTVRDSLTGSILRTPGVYPSEGEKDEIRRLPYRAQNRWIGNEWCDYCFTMAGGARVDNVRTLIEETIANGVPGDFLEAGTWRGGCSIMARLVQKALGEGEKRRTYFCDSFSGLPKASDSASMALDDDHWNRMHFLEVSQEEVQDNAKQFGALDENTLFRKGFFSESLPKVRQEMQAEGRQLAVLRGDGDMYESFTDILYNLYEFIPVGGYFICDDCPGIRAAQKAIDDFRSLHHITDPMHKVEGSVAGRYWRKSTATPVNYTYYLQWNATRAFRAA